MSYVGNTPTQQAFTPAVDYFSGNGSTVAFTLSRPVASVAQVQVTVNNVPQNPSTAFTVSGQTLTFTGAPSSGTNNIYVQYTSPITQVIQPGQGTVGNTQMTTGAALANIGAGGLTPTYLAQPLTLGTAQASTSGTSIDFTSIPSWVKRITVMFSGVSTSGTSNLLVQIGNGSPETTGYLSGESYIPTPAVTAITTGFPIHINNSSDTEHGAMVLVSLGSNKWVMTYTGYDSGNTYLHFSAGSKTTSAAPDRVRITTVNGTDTFDAGTINILYEG